MTNLVRSKFQAHPFHLVSPSPWPVYTSFALLVLTTSAASTMHSFPYAGYVLTAGFILVPYSMGLWWRDVISEGKKNFFNRVLSNNILSIVRAISPEKIKEIIKINNVQSTLNDDQFGYYLAGLLEGDGHLSLPFLGKTSLNRILNPRIVFTAHVNDLALYVHIQQRLGRIGRFQLSNESVIRYIIGDKQGIITFINIVHNKLRTPKNKSLNDLIEFMNQKYDLAIPKSNIDESNILTNSWFTGFTEADGSFGVKIVESKSKGDNKKSVSSNISLKFRLDQRLIDKKTSLSMESIMENIAQSLSCNLLTYKKSKSDDNILSVYVSAIDKVKILVDYFNIYPLLGIKNKNFKDWEKVYYMILSKEHLTEKGIIEIKLIHSNMNSKRIHLNYDI